VNEVNEQEFFEQWRSGNGESFGKLFQIYANRLYNLAYRLCGGEEEAKDLLQTSALRAFSSAHPCRNSAAFYSWMRQVLTNYFLDTRKAQKRAGRNLVLHDVTLDEVQPLVDERARPRSPRTELQESETMTAIQTALNGLGPEYLAVVILRDVEGLAYSQIAEIQGIPVETVRTRLRRARNVLREQLRPFMPGVESLI